jgi:multiple sugar transport system permease protein
MYKANTNVFKRTYNVTTREGFSNIFRLILSAIGYVLLAMGGILMVLPMVWMVSSSFKTSAEVFTVPVQWLPGVFHFDNYVNAMQLAPFGLYFFNSMYVGLSTTFLTLLFSSMAGYGFAKFNFWGKQGLFISVLSTMMIPFQVIMIALFVLVRGFGWLNTYSGLIIPAAVSAFGVFLMRQFILTIPDELIDAARIDGASEMNIYLHIILPLCKAPLSALGIFTFLDSWNNLLWPLIIITQVNMRTVALGLTEFQNLNGSSFNYLMAATTLASIPILILFIVLQRQFIRGVVLSGMKG